MKSQEKRKEWSILIYFEKLMQTQWKTNDNILLCDIPV